MPAESTPSSAPAIVPSGIVCSFGDRINVEAEFDTVRTGKRELIRDLNRALVLNLVRERRGISRAAIARSTGLSPSTVTTITASLLADRLLIEEGRGTEPDGRQSRSASVGRPATILRVDPAARHVIGVKLAPESLTATITDLDAEPMAMVTLPHAADGTLDDVVSLLEVALESLAAEAGTGDEEPLGIGVGLPGGVDPASGNVIRSPLPDWVNGDLASTLEERLGAPVLIDNDVNTLTVAEHLYGAGRGVDHLLVLTVGRGIGMGAVVDGAIVRGARGALGEIGHVTVVDEGSACWCGKHGCLEAEAAEPAVVRDVLAATGQRVPPDGMAAAADADEEIAAILDRAGRLVGRAVAAAIALLDPQRVVVSGEGVRLGRHYIEGIRIGVLQDLLPGAEADLVFEPWGDEAWARGAASLVLRELFTPALLRGEQSPARSQTRSRPETSTIVAS